MARWSCRSIVTVTMLAAAALYQDRVTGQTPTRADAAISGVVLDTTTKRPIQIIVAGKKAGVFGDDPVAGVVLGNDWNITLGKYLISAGVVEVIMTIHGI